MTNSTTTPARPPRPARPQAVLTVRSRHQLSAHTVRVIAGGPGLADFRTNDFTDKYVKITFVDPALGLIPPYDLAALRESLPSHQRPVSRTYTVRWVDLDRQQLAIDFVVHGDSGIAAPWASGAEPGDVIVLSGAGGGYRPDPSNGWHLFIGDESALPAICSALEALPPDARGIAYLETHDPDRYLDTEPPPGIEIHWQQRSEPGTQPRLLAEAVLAGPWFSGPVGVFAHGERESMKAVRAALKARLNDADQLSLSGYWAYGRTEDIFQAEKRQPIGQLDSIDRVNEQHLALCSSAEWADAVARWIIPWTLADLDLGDDVLEIGPGPGHTTAVLRTLTGSLTAVEIDTELATRLANRFVNTNVDVINVDARHTGLDDGRFSAAVALTMLHHVPGGPEQDAVFAEVLRVLRPGGLFAGSDSLDGPDFRELHHDDVCVPLNPDELAGRLAGIGFVEIEIETNEWSVRFRGRKPPLLD